MRTWLISIGAVLLTAGIVFFYFMYSATAGPLNDRQEEIKAFALSETELTSVNDISYYHGSRSYQVFYGVDDNDEDIIVWVEEIEHKEDDENQSRRVFVRSQSDGISKDKVEQIAYDRLNVVSLINIRLGIIGNTPVYEVVYIDDADRHSFYYLTFKDGSYIRHYQFKRS
ncbi:DUF5590 domain-containing protein [Bacillus shivajii]|uniref:cell wall elongation regulator TseB-like domain-containing protein n=1 Tax=Bacillus shivajii TaxID=1983719 RepID=UPI001CFA9CF2|nr:DUF5590 domain-containing protein [Bacillus shivajii]UCZ54814.1 DUF5590 domain-containing protein [Bacillus shivajii]